MLNSICIKTNYSLLSSLISIDSLIDFARNNKLKTLAICDDNLTSAKYFYNKCIENNIKPVIGLDVKYIDKSLMMYAINYEGYKNLIKLSTIMSEREILLDDLKNYNANLIVVIPYDSLLFYDEIVSLYEIIYIGVLNFEEEKQANSLNKTVFLN